MTATHKSKEWFAFTRRMRPIIAASLPQPCVDCGQPVMRGDKWHVGHIIPDSQGGPMQAWNCGPSHAKCNLSAGGRMGAAKTNAKRKTQRDNRTDMPKW